MALSKPQLSCGNWNRCGSKERDDWSKIKRTCLAKWNWGSVLKSLNTLKLKGSLDRSDSPLRRQKDGSSKPHAMAPLRQKFHDSRVLWDEVGANSENGVGKPPTNPGHCNVEKIVVAVDVDEESPNMDRSDIPLRRQKDGSSKPHAMAPLRQKFHDSRVLWDEVGANSENGVGKPPTNPGHCNVEKIVVAVDVDEVLGSFVSSLNKFIAERYSSYHTVSEYYVYEFFRIWKCSRAEAEIRVHDFFRTQYFTSGIEPIPGSYTVLCNLSTFCDLSVVTQNVIKDQTCHWIEKHYPGLFKEIHFGNHFALDGNSRPKSEICRSLGAQVLIDDNPRYALECAEAGIRVLLFDYRNSYPWCKDASAESHSLVTKVHNWEEVQQHLISWTVA